MRWKSCSQGLAVSVNRKKMNFQCSVGAKQEQWAAERVYLHDWNYWNFFEPWNCHLFCKRNIKWEKKGRARTVASCWSYLLIMWQNLHKQLRRTGRECTCMCQSFWDCRHPIMTIAGQDHFLSLLYFSFYSPWVPPYEPGPAESFFLLKGHFSSHCCSAL